jgi:hypothetical protein
MAVTRADGETSNNVTSLVLQRYQDSPKDDWDRLVKCWGYLDCGDCHRSTGFCGWCPIVRFHLLSALNVRILIELFLNIGIVIHMPTITY